ncbi:MAG: hypothetical protein HKN87_20005 [Saprospiraceae bacterium]|nr:hypothetical protein [Saprospiraceae bacterium]
MKHRTELWLIWVTLIAMSCAPVTQHVHIPEDEDLQSAEPQIVEEIEVDSVWAANRVWFDLQTAGNRQFVAYYDRNRMMTVASREWGNETWTRKTLSSKLMWDSHNSVVMALDRKGHIHVSGNMHTHPLVYYRTTRPYDVESLREINQMIGEDEASVTYPRFFFDQEGSLLFSYRSGTCGNGNILVNRYISRAGRWERYLKQPLFEGIEADDDRAAYHRWSKDSDGNFHFIWMWRWTPEVATSHQICYATSPDLKSWKNGAGQEVSLPFRPDDAQVIVDGTLSRGGMHNSRYQIIISPDDRPIIAYVKYDKEGMTQLYLAAFLDGQWKLKKISDWQFRWKFFEGGDQMTAGATFDLVGFSGAGALVIDWETETGNSGRYTIDPNTLANMDDATWVRPKYPNAIHTKITDLPNMDVRLVDDRAGVLDNGEKYTLKWETRPPSHGRHAPAVIPEGPLSPLMLVKIN